MLVLKKQVSSRSYEVLDTDDNSIEIATTNELWDCAKKLGIEIQGMSISKDGGLILQPQYDKSIKEVKLSFLQGVDMHVENGELLWFRFTDDVVRDIVINLSDYCDSIADYCFGNGQFETLKYRCNHTITCVLDDSISFGRYAFLNGFWNNVIKFDVSALSNKSAAVVYREANKNDSIGLFPNRGHNSVIDSNKKRMYYYWAERLLVTGLFNFGGSVHRIEEVIPYVDEYSEMLAKKYRKDFEVLVNKPITLKAGLDSDYKRSTAMADIYRKLSNCDFAYNKAHAYSTIKGISHQFLNMSYTTVDRLYNMVTLFYAPADIKSLWVQYVNNILKFSADYTDNL